MPYYILTEDTMQVVAVVDRPTQEQLQNIADDLGVDVYAVRGEHSGMSASPRQTQENECSSCGAIDMFSDGVCVECGSPR